MKLQTRTHRIVAGTAVAGMIAAGCVAMMPSGSAGVVAKSTSAACKESMEMWLYRSEGAQTNNMRLKLRQVAKDCATSERVYVAGSGINGRSQVMRTANDCITNYQLPAGDWMIKGYHGGGTRGFFQNGAGGLAGRSIFDLLPVGGAKCPNRAGFAIHSDGGVKVPSSSTSSARTSNGCIKLTGADLTDLHRRWASLPTIAEGAIRVHVVTVPVSALPAPGGGSAVPNPPTTTSPASDGAFVKSDVSATVYAMVGGFPVPISTMNPVGAKPVTVMTEASLASLRAANPYPRDGAFVKSDVSATVYALVGGYPVPISTMNPVGSKPYAVVTESSLTLLRAANPFPRDGAFVKSDVSASVYAMVGGFPVPISTMNPVGSKPYAVVTESSLTLMRTANPRPRDGAFVKSDVSATVYKIVGGYPVPISSMNQVGSKPIAVVTESSLVLLRTR